MKKLFFASLWVLACLTAACSDEKDEPNGESGSVVGEWVFQKNEYYRNGKMIDSFTAVEDEDKMIAVFREDGTFRYYDFPPEEYYDGTYSYDEASGVLVTDDGIEKQSCRAAQRGIRPYCEGMGAHPEGACVNTVGHQSGSKRDQVAPLPGSAHGAR